MYTHTCTYTYVCIHPPARACRQRLGEGEGGEGQGHLVHVPADSLGLYHTYYIILYNVMLCYIYIYMIIYIYIYICIHIISYHIIWVPICAPARVTRASVRMLCAHAPTHVPAHTPAHAHVCVYARARLRARVRVCIRVRVRARVRAYSMSACMHVFVSACPQLHPRCSMHRRVPADVE